MFDGIDPPLVWIVIGLVLAALEILVPGVYLIWLAIAALATGLLTLAYDPGIPLQVVEFVTLSLIVAFSAKRFLRDRPIVSSDPLLNRRGGRLLGETAVAATAFESGEGRVRHGDSEWLARGQGVGLGDRVRITGIDGATLLVAPIAADDAPGDGASPALPGR